MTTSCSHKGSEFLMTPTLVWFISMLSLEVSVLTSPLQLYFLVSLSAVARSNCCSSVLPDGWYNMWLGQWLKSTHQTLWNNAVLCAHDKMTAQANDSQVKSWVFEDQHSLQKKRAGWRIHQHDVICFTDGWLKDASQSLEYSKNYDRYWTWELFIKQVCCSHVGQWWLT